MSASRTTTPLQDLLEDADARLRGAALADELFDELDEAGLHAAHGVAGRLQDRVIAVLTRLTMEMANRDDGDGGRSRGR